jgi:signal transduction histidine kinase
LETLINEMLRFATMPAPKLAQGQIGTVLNDSLFLVRKQCQRQKVDLVESVAVDLPEIKMDADRLKQVLLNLYNNALDAMPDGGELKVSVALAGNSLRIVVADTGIGIAGEKIPLVFEPFYTSKGQGTGLGLAISYNIISDHGGDISVESQPGQGTSMTITLPLEYDA